MLILMTFLVWPSYSSEYVGGKGQTFYFFIYDLIQVLSKMNICSWSTNEIRNVAQYSRSIDLSSTIVSCYDPRCMNVDVSPAFFHLF